MRKKKTPRYRSDATSNWKLNDQVVPWLFRSWKTTNVGSHNTTHHCNLHSRSLDILNFLELLEILKRKTILQELERTFLFIITIMCDKLCMPTFELTCHAQLGSKASSIWLPCTTIITGCSYWILLSYVGQEMLTFTEHLFPNALPGTPGRLSPLSHRWVLDWE